MAEPIRRPERLGGNARRYGQFPEDLVGLRYGQRVIIAEVPRRRNARFVQVRCDCGNVGVTQIHNVARTTACMSCSQRARKDRRGPRQGGRPRELTTAIGKHMREARLRCPNVWLHGAAEDAGLSEEDRLCNREVRMQAVAELVGLLGPLSLTEIGELFDVTRERIRQIEAKAKPHMAKRCKLAGLEVPGERGPTMAETMELHSSAWGGES